MNHDNDLNKYDRLMDQNINLLIESWSKGFYYIIKFLS